MPPGLAGRLSRVLVGCHPRRWRERYAEEMLDVLDQHHPTGRTVASLAASALSTHVDPAYRTEGLSLRRAAKFAAAIIAGLAVAVGMLGYAAWRGRWQLSGAGVWAAWRSRPVGTCWSVPSEEQARTAWTPMDDALTHVGPVSHRSVTLS